MEPPGERQASDAGITSGSSFLQLFSAIKRVKVFRWFGMRGYQAGLKSRKRAGRKGAMLDVHVD